MIDLFLKLKIKAIKRNHNRTKRFINYDELQRVCLLFDIADHDHIVPLVDELISDGKEVRAWVYSAKGHNNQEYPFFYTFISDTELNFWFFPKKDIMNQFLGYPADLLIDLCYRPNAVTEFLLASSPALYRVGLKTYDPVWYDMIVDIKGREKEEMEKNAGSVLFYLKKLRVK